MAEVFGPLGLGLASLNFVLTTLSNVVRAVDTFRERMPQLRAIELRLAACLDQFACWEDYWRHPQLEANRELCLTAMEDVKSLAAAIKKETKKMDMSEGQERAWKKMKRAIRQGVFYRPKSGLNYVGEAVAYNLWTRGLLEDWINRLEKVIESMKKLHDRDFHNRTGEYYNEDLSRSRELLRLEKFASNLNSKARGLHKACTALSGTRRWALALHPPLPGEDISRWDFQPPISIELRFRSNQNQEEHNFFRLRVAHEDGVSVKDTVQEVINEVKQTTEPEDMEAFTVSALAECHRQDLSTRETLPVSNLLENQPGLFEGATWLEGLPERVFGISEWSLLFWNTPWLEELCCHGLTVEIDSDSARRTRHIFESKQHNSCQSQHNVSGLQKLGLVYAQLVLGLPIRPSSTNIGFEFEIKVNGKWGPISVRGIHAEVNKATGSQSLVEAMCFCLGPGTEHYDENFKFGYLHKLIDKIHKPIKNWCESQSAYVGKIKEIEARITAKLPQIERWAEEIMEPTVKADDHVSEEAEEREPAKLLQVDKQGAEIMIAIHKDHCHPQGVADLPSGRAHAVRLVEKYDHSTDQKFLQQETTIPDRTYRPSSRRFPRSHRSPVGDAWI